MTRKAALARLDLGGGKAVVIGDPEQRTREQLLAFGEFVESPPTRKTRGPERHATLSARSAFAIHPRRSHARVPGEPGRDVEEARREIEYTYDEDRRLTSVALPEVTTSAAGFS